MTSKRPSGAWNATPGLNQRAVHRCAPHSERGHSMMGTKARLFTPVPAVTLDELVPADHFYRHLERVLDLTFVRDLVRDCYAACGRPSVDPVVFFKIHTSHYPH
jgi:hypothetical protein